MISLGQYLSSPMGGVTDGSSPCAGMSGKAVKGWDVLFPFSGRCGKMADKNGANVLSYENFLKALAMFPKILSRCWLGFGFDLQV